MIDDALRLAGLGFPVFPLHEPVPSAEGLRCSCLKPGCSKSAAKHPRTPHGVDDASVDPEQIRLWWKRWPTANLGISCRHNLLVVDLDGAEAIASWAALTRGHEPIETSSVRTSRGYHLWFWQVGPPEVALGNTASKLAPGIDTRGRGGYVLAPSSRHVSGHVYSWATDPPWIHGGAITYAPTWLVDVLTPRPVERFVGDLVTAAGADRILAGLIQVVLDSAEGTRNHRLFWAGARAAEHSLAKRLIWVEAERGLTMAAEEIGLSEGEIALTLQSARRTAAGGSTA